MIRDEYSEFSKKRPFTTLIKVTIKLVLNISLTLLKLI